MAIAHPPYLSSDEHRAAEVPVVTASTVEHRSGVRVPGKNYLVQLGASAALWVGAAMAIRSILR